MGSNITYCELRLFLDARSKELAQDWNTCRTPKGWQTMCMICKFANLINTRLVVSAIFVHWDLRFQLPDLFRKFLYSRLTERAGGKDTAIGSLRARARVLALKLVETQLEGGTSALGKGQLLLQPWHLYEENEIARGGNPIR